VSATVEPVAAGVPAVSVGWALGLPGVSDVAGDEQPTRASAAMAVPATAVRKVRMCFSLWMAYWAR
jgi:hypothetical protein